jgi:hypothetical protein
VRIPTLISEDEPVKTIQIVAAICIYLTVSAP